MTLDERCTQIITVLLNAREHLSLEKITKQVGVSKRTFYYDIQKINSWLAENELEPVQKKHGKGFLLNEETKRTVPTLINHVNNFQYFYSSEERKTLIAVNLLTSTKPVFIEELIKLTQVSRASVSNDLKEIKAHFNKHQLEIKFHRNEGYIVSGNEQYKRQLLVELLEKVIVSKNDWNRLSHIISLPFHESSFGTKGMYIHLNRVRPLIEECETELSIELTDEMMHLLSLKLIVIIQRLLHGNRITIDQDEQAALQSTIEYRAVKNIGKKLEAIYHLQIPDSEICFITMNLLGSKINYSELESNQSMEMKNLRTAVKKIVQDFQNYACVLFHDSLQVEESLYKHLKPTYYRIKYDVGFKDDYTQNFIREYPEIFQLTKKTIHHLEQLIGTNIQNTETAYIAMHFGGWLQREGKKPLHRKKALIVCENGLGTSNILWGQLDKIISTVDIIGCISLRQYESNEYDVDLVFSTSVIKEKKHPVLIVNPFLTDQDKEAVLSFVNNQQVSESKGTVPTLPAIMNIIRNHSQILNEKELIQELSLLFNEHEVRKVRDDRPVLNELLTKETIQFHSKVSDWKEAISVAAAPLIKNGSITEEYVNSMIANVEELGPYIVIAPNIALPHARPENGVHKIGMSLLRLEESVYFSKEEKHKATLIIVLAAVDNERHLKALSQLSTMLSDEKILQHIMSAEEADDLLKYINEYSFV